MRVGRDVMGVINPLAGRPLRYLIGAESVGLGDPCVVTVVPYDHKPVRNGWSVGYCNLLEETTKAGRYPPYLKPTDTAEEYDERVIDPKGLGWTRNLSEQFALRKRQGIEYIELDNPDAYSIEDVIGAIELAAGYGLKVIAKNPGLMGWRAALKFVGHSNVDGIIVEHGAGDVHELGELRHKAAKPDLPVWFVSFGPQRHWAYEIARSISDNNFHNMGVTYSKRGEYESVDDILLPKVK